MKKSEHYKNNPNDIESTSKEKKVSAKLNRLRDKIRIIDVEKTIAILLLKNQIYGDQKIKEMFLEMYPNEYRKASMAKCEKYGYSVKRKVKRKEIIKNMKLKNPYLIKHLIKNDTTI